MRNVLDPNLEDRADRLTLGILVAMLAVGLVGALTADNDVPLQVNGEGFTSFVSPVVAALVYPIAGLITRFITFKNPIPWVRWSGRLLVAFILAFEVAAFIHAL